MATSTANLVYDNSTITNFKQWGSGISAGILSVGWTQTTDTGQVNWSTIATVPASTTVYEVWKSSDGLSSTLPIFIKIGYGFSTTAIRIQISAGTGSDGAGNLTGVLLTSQPWVAAPFTVANQGATTFPCYFAGNGGNLYMYLWSSTLSISVCMLVERSKDATGASTGDYFTVIQMGANNSSNSGSAFQQTVKSSGLSLRDTGIIGVGITSGSATGSAFGTVAAYPVFPNIGKVGNPLLGLMTAYVTDIGNNSTVTVASMYGSTHTYIAMSPGTNNSTDFSSALAGRTFSFTRPGGLILFE